MAHLTVSQLLELVYAESKYIDSVCGMHANDRSAHYKTAPADVGYMSDSGSSQGNANAGKYRWQIFHLVGS